MSVSQDEESDRHIKDTHILKVLQLVLGFFREAKEPQYVVTDVGTDKVRAMGDLTMLLGELGET